MRRHALLGAAAALLTVAGLAADAPCAEEAPPAPPAVPAAPAAEPPGPPPPPPPAEEPPGPPPPAAGPTAAPSRVAEVGGVVVTKDELADFVFSRFREQWRQAVDELVDERLVATQAAALGVTVPPAALDAAVDAEARARAEQLRARFGDGADLARSVLEYYGLEVEAWKREILRPRLEVHLALQRVVRLSARTRDQVVARVIVVKDRAKAEAVRAKVAAGADFSLTALEASEDPSREQGGVVAPIGRGDLPLPAVEAALFGARPGALVGPLEVATAAGPEFHLYRVVEQVPAWPGPPEARRVRLEEDLRTNPVTRTEYERWAARSRRAQGVRVFGPDGSVLREVGPGR